MPGKARSINPEDYGTVPAYELLQSAAHGYIGLDHRFLRAIIDRRAEALPDVLRFAAEIMSLILSCWKRTCWRFCANGLRRKLCLSTSNWFAGTPTTSATR